MGELGNKMSRTFEEVEVVTKRGSVLHGLFFKRKGNAADTIAIIITGIHGNLYSNRFYINIGETLAAGGVDFMCAMTCNAFPEIHGINKKTGAEETIGSWNERFSNTKEDIEAYMDFAVTRNYKHIILGGHSLGANKVIYYPSTTGDARVEHFLLLSPANLTYMMSEVTEAEKNQIKTLCEAGKGEEMLPFYFMGWVECIAHTAYDWVYGNILNNVHTDAKGDFSQAEKIQQSGALFIGTYDRFTDGDPCSFLQNLNGHMPRAKENTLIFLEKTGHTYQQKEQEIADRILEVITKWKH